MSLKFPNVPTHSEYGIMGPTQYCGCCGTYVPRVSRFAPHICHVCPASKEDFSPFLEGTHTEFRYHYFLAFIRDGNEYEDAIRASLRENMIILSEKRAHIDSYNGRINGTAILLRNGR